MIVTVAEEPSRTTEKHMPLRRETLLMHVAACHGGTVPGPMQQIESIHIFVATMWCTMCPDLQLVCAPHASLTLQEAADNVSYVDEAEGIIGWTSRWVRRTLDTVLLDIVP